MKSDKVNQVNGKQVGQNIYHYLYGRGGGIYSGITSGQERSRNFLNASWVQAILGFVPTKYSTNFDLSCPLKTAEAGPRAPQKLWAYYLNHIVKKKRKTFFSTSNIGVCCTHEAYRNFMTSPRSFSRGAGEKTLKLLNASWVQTPIYCFVPTKHSKPSWPQTGPWCEGKRDKLKRHREEAEKKRGRGEERQRRRKEKRGFEAEEGTSSSKRVW